jgi:hypothetical protein
VTVNLKLENVQISNDLDPAPKASAFKIIKSTKLEPEQAAQVIIIAVIWAIEPLTPTA